MRSVNLSRPYGWSDFFRRGGCLLPLLPVIAIAGIAILVFVGAWLLFPPSYAATFDQAGSWGSDNRADVVGQVSNGVYDMEVKANYGVFYATAGESFTDGIYEVEATQISGPLNNGYGMLFRVSGDSFYVFEISGDGFIWIGRCTNLCQDEAVPLVGRDWFPSPAVNQGLQATNLLRLVADGGSMTFFVNGIEVGRTTDDILTQGDIAVMVETLGQRGVRVVFDNFRVASLGNGGYSR
jgi:hypothetical protein